MKIGKYYSWMLRDISMRRRFAIFRWMMKNKGLWGPYPLYSKIEITQKCNLKCPQCFRTTDGLTSGKEMSYEQFTEVIDKLGPAMAEVWTHGFGEPLAHPDFIDMMRYVRKKGMVWGLATNGTLFNRHNLLEMMELQPTNIRFSIDAADPEIFEMQRPPAKLKDVHANFLTIKGLRDDMYPKKRKWRYIKKQPLVSIYSVISRNTVDQIPKLVQLSKDWGADYISFSDMTWNNEYGTSTSDTGLGTTMSWWEMMQLRLPYRADKTVQFSFPNRMVRPCAYPKMHAYIDADGEVYPCTCTPALEPPEIVPIGNIFEVDDITEIYQSDKWNQFREFSAKPFLQDVSSMGIIL
jgi:MoaA/NifB/PqqE/SkfB family radical SAM enzyme